MADQTEFNQLNILFTANLQANFDAMPYLATTLRSARIQSSSEAPRPTLVLDLGQAWSPKNWLCQATENRAPYLILDAMGYTVVRADGLDVGGILGLRSSVQVTLLDDSIAHKWRKDNIELNIGRPAQIPAIRWALPDEKPASDQKWYDELEGALLLYPPTDFVGKLVVDYPSLAVIESEQLPIRANRPDPSILEMVKFVEQEARAYQARQSKGDSPE